jgi:hypothetical protein
MNLARRQDTIENPGALTMPRPADAEVFSPTRIANRLQITNTSTKSS